jgi:hypothetical protein
MILNMAVSLVMGVRAVRWLTDHGCIAGVMGFVDAPWAWPKNGMDWAPLCLGFDILACYML